MELPAILRKGVFLDLLEMITIVSSDREETASLLLQSHCEVDLGRGHLVKLSYFSIRHYCSKMREQL